NQIISMLGQNFGQPGPVPVMDNLGNGFLYVPVVQQPFNGFFTQVCSSFRFFLGDTLKQCIAEQIVITKPFVMGIQRNQKQVLGKQLFQQFLAVVLVTNAVAQRSTQAWATSGVQQK